MLVLPAQAADPQRTPWDHRCLVSAACAKILASGLGHVVWAGEGLVMDAVQAEQACACQVAGRLRARPGGIGKARRARSAGAQARASSGSGQAGTIPATPSGATATLPWPPIPRSGRNPAGRSP